LINFIKTLQHKAHTPKLKFDIIVGNGSQDLITKCIEMLIENDNVLLIEEPTYVGVLAFLKPLRKNIKSVKTDQEGIVIENLKEILKSTKVKCLYTVPNGGNPTGVTQSLQRKSQVYNLCKEYGVLILEDDPYYYLQYEDKIESYLSMDTVGIVIRFDSFSKCVSAGLRMGFMTAHPLFVERIELHKQVTDLHSSGASMMILWKTLELLSYEGFLQNCIKVSLFYKERGTVFCNLVDKYLAGKVEYVRPKCGMFVWLKLLGIKDSFSFVENECRDALVLLLPGKVFYWDDDQVTNYCRVSFSVASDAEMETGIKRLAELLK
jgi:DNA-binding transcriptional MocR family regulator